MSKNIPILEIPIFLYNRLYKTFIQSDQHYNHEAIFKTREDEIITNIHIMNNMIIEQFLKLPKGSDIYLVGDFWSIDFFPQVFIDQNVYVQMGNHELSSVNNLKFKMDKLNDLNLYDRYNFTFISDPYIIPGTSIILTHDPDKTIKDHILLPNEIICHGHYHNKNGKGVMSGIYKPDIGYWPDSQYINVAADMTEDFRVLSLGELLHNKHVPVYSYESKGE